MEKLREYSLVKTQDLDEARDSVTTTYLPNHLTQLGPGQLDMTLNAVEDYDVTVGYLTYATTVNLQMPASEEFYHVNLTTDGHTDARRDDKQTVQSTGGSSGVVLLPHLSSWVTWSDDAEQVILRLSRRRLENHLAQLLGREIPEPIHFDLGLNLTTDTGRGLLTTALAFADELDRLKNVPHLAFLQRSWEELVMTQLLFAAGHNYRETLAYATGGYVDSDLLRVLEHIEQRLQFDLSPQELATIAGRSIRSIYVMFRDQLDTTPREYICRQRLQKVRRELEHPHNTTSVSDSALTWGFTHLGRFAAIYKDHFGEMPSTTLHSARRST